MTQTPDPASPAGLLSAGLTRYATVLKMAAIAVLVLLLLIPLLMVHAVLRDRLQRRDAAVREMTSSWGSEQTVFGPVLVVPYRQAEKISKEQVVNGRVERIETTEMPLRRAFFLPASLKAEAQLDPSRLHRGIYESVVYKGTIRLSGAFARPSFEEWSVDPQHVLWDEAEIDLAVTDLRGAQEAVVLNAGGRPLTLRPGSRLEVLKGGVYARLTGLSEGPENLPFDVTLTLNGHRSLRFAPIGVSNDVTISSTWPDPSFQGSFLPSRRDVRADGFTARWQVSYYGRTYPQQWTGSSAVTPALINASLFGVDLVPDLDSYRFVERAIKYGVLVIVLVFTAFFLFEVLAAARVHPFQYSLVGAAICLFYLVLLALSEVLAFGMAYWIGAAAATLMISLYCVKALGSVRRAGVAAGGLATVFGFLYVILRLQDLSLLVGTAGLFAVLAILMYLTRNIDWYARDGA
jgi:inner membrane protein